MEKEYECRKIKTLHELLISAEEYGGEADDSISLLLNDVELWKRRGYLLQGENKKADAMLEKYTKIADDTFNSVLGRLK